MKRLEGRDTEFARSMMEGGRMAGAERRGRSRTGDDRATGWRV